MSRYLGIDIGGTTIKAALVERDGQVSKKTTVATPQEAGNEGFLSALDEILNNYGQDDFMACGIGSVGPLDLNEGVILKSANVPTLKNCPILPHAKTTLKNLGKEIRAELNNDASVTALSQYYFGIGRGVENLATMTLGTGIGGGLLLNKKLYSGYKGNGFEIGHIPVNDPFWQPGVALRQCGCGAWGCLETFASATGVVEYYYLFTEKRLTAREIAEAARSGDEQAQKVFKVAGQALGLACVSITHMLNLPLIIITGGMAAAHDLLEPHINLIVEERLFDVFKGYTEIKFTEGDENFGIVGAAALCF